MASLEENLPIVGVSDLDNAVAEGYLEKKRKEKMFRSEKHQKRWCVIQDDTFYYFTKSTDVRQKGGFHLKGYSFHKLGDLSFSIVCEGRRPYEFVAPSKDEVEKWRKAILKGSAAKKKLRKSDSCPGVESAAPVSPTRDRSISIPSDKNTGRISPKLKQRSHTPDPFERSSYLNSPDRSRTLGRPGVRNPKTEPLNIQLKKTQSSPYVHRSTGHQPALPSRTSHSPVLKSGYSANLINQKEYSSSDESNSDYDTVDEPVRPTPAPRPKPVVKLPLSSEKENKRNVSMKRQQIPAPRLTSQSRVISSDEEEEGYDYLGEPLLRPESDYDIAGNFLRKQKESLGKTCSEEDDSYIDVSKLDSMPNTNRIKKSNQAAPAVCQPATKQQEDDIYFEPTAGFAQVDQTSRSQIHNVLDSDNENPYFIPMEESVHLKNEKAPYLQPELEYNESDSGEENLYFEPIADNDLPDVAVAGSIHTPKSRKPIPKTESVDNDGYIKVRGNSKKSNRTSDGYSKPEEVTLLKRKPATANPNKSGLYTDDTCIYVNLPRFIPEPVAPPGQQQSKNTTKLQNVKLKDSVEDNSDSDDYEYSEF